MFCVCRATICEGERLVRTSAVDPWDESVPFRYLSLFSGIEAATVAWEPLGWECVGVCEIEPFPCAVLSHHYPDVPNLGDISKITEEQIGNLGRIDAVVWGSPCQDLSVAGKKRGLSGKRSGLFRIGWKIVQMARKNNGCRFSIWENVPGAFSTGGGRDFAEVVATMAGLEHVDPPPYGFGTEGVAVGPNGLVEWATLDAQWRGVAQRRRRVFALADFGNWQDRPPILLEPEGLRGDSPPSRKEGKGFAPDIALCLRASGTGTYKIGQKSGEDSLIADVAWALQERNFKGVDSNTKQGHLIVEVPEVCATISSSGSSFARAGGYSVSDSVYITELERNIHSSAVADVLRSGGDGGVPSSRGENIIVESFSDGPLADDENLPSKCFPINTQVALRHEKLGDGTGLGIGADGDPAYTLQEHHSHAIAIAFDCKASGLCGFGTGDIAAPLRSMGHEQSHQYGGGHSAVVTCEENPGCGKRFAVRRLTVVECSRLQGFPDDYLTKVPWKGKTPPPDGLMYRALGNSMAVPVMRLIGERISDALRWEREHRIF